MPHFLETYGDCEGPLGFPMLDQQARTLEKIIKDLPRDGAYAYRKLATFKAPAELLPGERADVSWITTEDVDRDREVVIASGMDDAQFRLNPLVTLGHAYDQPPVGKSRWRRRARDGQLVGVKAKTHYPRRPDDWPGDEWAPDFAFALIQADLLRGKSIGFLPLKVHPPTPDEIRQKPAWADVRLVIDEWLLLEYACCFLPCQPNAVVEAVSKASEELGEPFRAALPGFLARHGMELAPQPDGPIVPFTTLEEIEAALARRLRALDLNAVVADAVRAAVERKAGRV